jgi:uncharacterized protein (UPF0276 family)
VTTAQPDESSSLAGSTLASLPRLGVGILYNPALPAFLHSELESFDYAEIIPDTFWTDRGVGQSPRYEEIESSVDFVNWLTSCRPVLCHSIGLSIGSAEIFDVEHIEQIAHWQRRYAFPWHSDHLSFARVNGEDGHDHNAGLSIPVPYDEDVLELIASRVAYIQRRISTKFLLENNVYYVDIPDQDMSEPEFLNKLSAMTDCGLLLDVHNVYTNARNHGFDPARFIDDLDLSRVVEVHIAGGSEYAGMYTDSHAGPCPEPVWDLLDWVAAQAANLCAITFEFHESYYPLLKTAGIREQLEQARNVWIRYH